MAVKSPLNLKRRSFTVNKRFDEVPRKCPIIYNAYRKIDKPNYTRSLGENVISIDTTLIDLD